jgi:molybdenum cofactor cytidylyltransferase
MKKPRDDQQRIFAVVLAAGKSTRFGALKQLASFGDESLVLRAARLARAVCGDNSLLVTGYRCHEVLEAAQGVCSMSVFNDEYERGMASSIAIAARTLAGTADAMLILLADQPLVNAAHLRDIAASWSGACNEIVASGYGEHAGPPVLLPEASFAELQILAGDQGARQLFSDPRYTLKVLKSEPAGIDIDTPEDLARLAQGDSD